MLRNFLKVAFRSFWRHKVFSLINLLGLVVGLSCFLLIALWIRSELSYDRFHAFSDRLYRVMENQHYTDGTITTQAAAPGLLGEALKAETPEIVYASTMDSWTNTLVSYGDKHIKEEGRYVGEDFLKMFSFPLIAGDKETALLEPNSIVISQQLADKFFPGVNPIGKTLKIANRLDYQVTGVLADLPDNTIFEFSYLMPLTDFLARNAWARNWNNNGLHTFVMLEKGADPNQVNAKIRDFVKAKGTQDHVDLFLQPLTDIYLKTDYEDGVYQGGGRIEYVRIFGLIAILLLVIAIINFMNLSTARATVRSKEVGVRKVIGAGRWALIRQFIGEALLMCFLALGVALVAINLLLPWFTQFTGQEISIPLHSGYAWAAIGGIVLLTGLLAGSYPAFILSRFQPVSVLKGQLDRSQKGALLRKGLVVVQFSISIFLITGVIVIQRQLNYLQNKNLGYQKDHLLFISMDKELQEKFTALRSDLERLPEVNAVSASHSRLTGYNNSSTNFSWAGKNPEEKLIIVFETVSENYLNTIGAQLLEGRDFVAGNPADSANFVINESAARLMGLTPPYAGQTLTAWGKEGQIIGVVKDFNFTSLKEPIEPLILTMNNPFVWTLYVRMQTSQPTETLAEIGQICKKYSPAFPFEYEFADAAYQKLYKSEQIINQLSSVFAFLAIFISCLGLFGLATFTTERRIKEIGIRKVLGASIGGIVAMLSRDFLKPVLLAVVLASPVAWYYLNNWLGDFAYRIDIEWWIFALTAFIGMGIAFLTISFQSIKAASSNPVNSLRSE